MAFAPASRSRFRRALAVLAGTFLATALTAAEQPPVVAPFAPKAWDLLSQREISAAGAKALEFKPERWLHGESEHFVYHFRRLTEAVRVALEIEYYLWWVARSLAAGPERYAKKSHVFIFEDERDWAEFKAAAELPPWSGSAAVGDELFLSVREARTGMFHSQTLAHETVHAVVARLYPRRRWPSWLNEGYAEAAGTAASAARLGQWPGNPPLLPQGDLALDVLLNSRPVATTSFVETFRFYRSSERLVRFLLAEIGAERFPMFVDRMVEGGDFAAALVHAAPERYPHYGAFLARWERWKSLNR